MHLTFGSFVRALRAYLGWTQERLTEQCEVEPRSVLRWEQDRHRPHKKQLDHLLNADQAEQRWFPPLRHPQWQHATADHARSRRYRTNGQSLFR